MRQSGPKISKIEWFAVGLISAIVILTSVAAGALAQDRGLLRIYFLDVGQGDAEFIESPSGSQVLIDGGPDDAVIQRLGEVMPFFDRSIDLLILTHPHADHVTGLNEVLQRYEVEKIVENEVDFETPEYAEWNRLKEEAEVSQARRGMLIDLGGGAILSVLYPFESGSAGKVKTPHDYMVVAKLNYGRESVLLTGDAEAKVEQKMIAAGGLKSDFLKIGHHGSKTSTAESFLRAVDPELAFIEVGARNRYGHPHPTVLERLAKFGIKYYRSDIDGTKELILDGENFLIK